MAAKTKKDQNSSNRSKKIADDILKEIKKEEILSSAQKVISSAVNVLEEEIAAGILAAKKIEKKVLNLEEINQDPDDLMNRIRRDTHEAVDLFLDAITALTKHINKLTVQESHTKGEEGCNKIKTEPTLLMLAPDKTLKAGETEVLTFSLLEDSAEDVDISFQKTSLFGPNGKNISATAIKVDPLYLTLKPKEKQDVIVRITLPKHAEPGNYYSIISDKENTLVKVILNLEVI